MPGEVESNDTIQQAVPTPASQRASEYDLGDTSTDTDIEATSPGASAAQPDPKPAALPPRDPDTGRFQKAPAHSARTLRMAKDLGITDEEIANTIPEALDDIVYHLNKRQLAEARAAKRDELTWSATEPRPAPKPEQGAQPEAKPQEEWETFAEDDGENSLDSRIAKVLNKLTAKIKAQDEMIRTLTGREIHREHMTAIQKVDAAIASLGHDDFFGAGPISALPKDSVERQRREMIVAQAKKLAGDKASTEQLVAKISEAKAIFGLTSPAPAGKPARITEEQWENGGVNRPTRRVGPPEPKGDKRAIKAAAGWMKENGYLDDRDELDGFPE